MRLLPSFLPLVAPLIVFGLLGNVLKAQTPDSAATALLPNGDFKTDDGKGWPAGWSKPDGASWESEGDIHFIRLKAATPDKMWMAFRQVSLPAQRPPALELRLKVRYDGVTVGTKSWFDARVMLQFKDASGENVAGGPGAPNFHGSSKGAWVEKSIFFPIPEDATVLQIMPCLFQVAQGTFDIAECDIFPAKADQLPPPPPMIASTTAPFPPAGATVPMLHVAGNQLQTGEGKPVWLQGLCLDSMEWGAAGEHILQSIPVATEQWHANVIRLPVKDNFWWGWGPYQKKGDNGETYRKLVDSAVSAAASKGAYLVLDLHKFGAPVAEDIAFWKDAALRYKDNPAVLFELFNEPHDISWKLWRYGGSLKDPSNAPDTHVKENNEKVSGKSTVGIQALVDAVRSTGAKNIVIAGGLGWSYDLSGVVNGFALEEHAGGNGIMYSHHNYPWKKDWNGSLLGAAAKYPIFVGEVGCPRAWEDFKFIPVNEQSEKLGPDCPWPADMLGLIQKLKLNWTGFSFHPKCGPMVISDWDYTPTPYWGAFVKRALAGEKFEMKQMR